MRIPRIFDAHLFIMDSTIELSETASRHLSLVLRLQINDEVILFNGDGNDYLGSIVGITKKSVQVRVVNKISNNKESILPLHLGQAISRSEKMDWVIQKVVELGVTEITPLMTQYCAVKMSLTLLEKKIQHWQAIIISSCEQCGRNCLPTLHLPLQLSDWFAKSHGCRLVFDPEAHDSLKSLVEKPSSVSILIGPEGGLSEVEIQTAKQHGFLAVKLGPRILRTETAAIAAITAVQQLWGDF